MTKRQRQARIRAVGAELIEHMRKRFPAVELIATDERPDGMVVLQVYAPYESNIDVLASVADRIVDHLVDEDLSFAILPVREKPAQRAA